MKFIDLATQQQRIKPLLDQRLQAVLAHGQYIMGPEIVELEDQLAKFVGVDHCISVASGTDALLIAMMALGVKAGDEVITTPFTFIATGEMIRLLGAIPVFVDIDPYTYNLDPAKLTQAITARTKAIIGVNLFGQCADYQAINAVAAQYHIPVIEDAAQSFGATHHGEQSCSLTTIGCTSFFPSKPLGCYGDGGACFTNDAALATTMRQIRVHGQSQRYQHNIIGINGRLDTMQAAVLLAKLTIFTAEVKARQQIADYYNQLLQDIAAIPTIMPENTSVYAQYTIQIEERDTLREQLKAAGIPTAVHYPKPLHLQPAFADLAIAQQHFPIAEEVAKKVISVPMHPYLKKETISTIAAKITKILAGSVSMNA